MHESSLTKGNATANRPSVLDLIDQRLQGGAERAPDAYRLGLAIEGGGMRGIVSAAGMIALAELGLLGTFDAVFGTSAGSINAAYVLAGQPWSGLSIYYDHLATGQFIRFTRLLRGQSVVSMAAVERILDLEVPLRCDEVIDSRPQLVVGVSNLSSIKPELRSDFAGPEDLKRALVEGAHLPVLAGRPACHSNQLYVDGGVFFPHPLYAAIAGGCTHVLVLTTRHQGHGRRKVSLWQRSLARVLNNWSEGSGDYYLEEVKRWLRDRQTLTYGPTTLDGVIMHRIASHPGRHHVQRLTRDREILLDSARVGYSDVINTFQEIESSHDVPWVFSIRKGDLRP